MDIIDLIKRSWEIGSAVKLDGVKRIGGRDKVAPDYYHFLYGLCKLCAFRRILEIGTDYGGSIIAMHEAVGSRESTLVTVDITANSDAQLLNYPDIIKIRGDSNRYDTIAEVIRHFSEEFDLLYIDTEHDFHNTMMSYAIYNSLLEPRCLVFDDITLNDEMKRFWEIMKRRYGTNAINTVEVVPEIRGHPANPGFGLIMPLGRL